MRVGRALISLSNKEGIAEFASRLNEVGIEIISTGGTASHLMDNGIQVTSVESCTGFPEIMDGRVKTLHPRIHGGILAVRGKKGHIADMEKNGIKPIDMVVANLYPFQETVARDDVTLEKAVENIDIGGPTMVRSAAKNHEFVTVIVDPDDYNTVASQIEKTGSVSQDTKERLAVKAFEHTAEYDRAIVSYLKKVY